MEKHRSLHVKNEAFEPKNFRKYTKHERCGYPNCRYSRTLNHIHCTRDGCNYVVHSASQIESHNRKHLRKEDLISVPSQVFQPFSSISQLPSVLRNHPTTNLAFSLNSKNCGWPASPISPASCSSPTSMSNLLSAPTLTNSSSGVKTLPSITFATTTTPSLPLNNLSIDHCMNTSVVDDVLKQVMKELSQWDSAETWQRMTRFQAANECCYSTQTNQVNPHPNQQQQHQSQQQSDLMPNECRLGSVEHYHCLHFDCQFVERSPQLIRQHCREHAAHLSAASASFLLCEQTSCQALLSIPADAESRHDHFHCKFPGCEFCVWGEVDIKQSVAQRYQHYITVHHSEFAELISFCSSPSSSSASRSSSPSLCPTLTKNSEHCTYPTNQARNQVNEKEIVNNAENSDVSSDSDEFPRSFSSQRNDSLFSNTYSNKSKEINGSNNLFLNNRRRGRPLKYPRLVDMPTWEVPPEFQQDTFPLNRELTRDDFESPTCSKFQSHPVFAGFMLFHKSSNKCPDEFCLWSDHNTQNNIRSNENSADHFHCVRPRCRFAAPDIVTVNQHRSQFHATTQIELGYEFFGQFQDCRRFQCVNRRVFNHFHCTRPNCDYTLKRPTTMLQHNKKHYQQDMERGNDSLGVLAKHLPPPLGANSIIQDQISPFQFSSYQQSQQSPQTLISSLMTGMNNGRLSAEGLTAAILALTKNRLSSQQIPAHCTPKKPRTFFEPENPSTIVPQKFSLPISPGSEKHFVVYSRDQNCLQTDCEHNGSAEFHFHCKLCGYISADLNKSRAHMLSKHISNMISNPSGILIQ